MTRKLKVFAIPDCHFPWVDIKNLTKIYDEIENECPQVVIQLGDLYDRFSFSRFARSHNICTPKQEVEEAREMALNFWKNITEASPKSRKIQLRGNHEQRILSQTLDRFPEIYSIVSRSEADLLKFKGVETIEDAREETEIEGVIYTHGYLTQLGAHCKHMLKPVVHGHSHRGGTVFYNLGGKLIWELDCGYIADNTQVPLQYGMTKTTLWTTGYGIIDKRGPRFVPL